MAEYYDSAGRYHYLSDRFAEIQPGTKMIIESTSSWKSDTRYSEVTEVTRTSGLSFWLANPFDSPKKEIRFNKRDGHEYGTYGYRTTALFATPENVAKANKYRKETQTKKAKAYAEARARMAEIRRRYGAEHIENPEVQKILHKVRELGEEGRKAMERFFKDLEGASIEKPWIAIHNTKTHDRERLEFGANMHESAEHLHNELVNLVNQFEAGQVFYQKDGYRRYSPNPSDPEEHTTTCCVMLLDHIRYIAVREVERTLDRGEFKPGEAEFIKKLRHIVGERYNCKQVVAEKKEEAA